MNSPHATPTAFPVTDRFAFVIAALCRMAASRAGRQRQIAPLVLVLWPYLRRLQTRFDGLIARLRAGELAPSPPRQRTKPDGETGARPSDRPPQLPRRFAWLLDLVPEAAQLGTHVRLVLADPETAALLQATPQAGRLLRPLCRMMGIRPEPGLPPILFPPRRLRPRRANCPTSQVSRPPDRLGISAPPTDRLRSANWPKLA